MPTYRERFAVIAIVLPALAGCATTPVFNYSVQTVDVSEPTLGSVNIAHRGESIVRQGRYRELDVIHVERDTPVGLTGVCTIGYGYYYKVGQDKRSSFYYPTVGEGGRLNCLKTGSRPIGILQAYDAKPTLCLVDADGWSSCNHGASFKRSTRVTATVLEQKLVYAGRAGSTIKIGYRESADDDPQLTSSKDLELDLKDSRILSYHGAQVEVLEATDEYLQYRVLHDFDRLTQ